MFYRRLLKTVHLFSYARSPVPPYLKPTSQISIKLSILSPKLNFAEAFQFTFNFDHVVQCWTALLLDPSSYLSH
jgi:hypothetical protein